MSDYDDDENKVIPFRSEVRKPTAVTGFEVEGEGGEVEDGGGEVDIDAALNYVSDQIKRDAIYLNNPGRSYKGTLQVAANMETLADYLLEIAQSC